MKPSGLLLIIIAAFCLLGCSGSDQNSSSGPTAETSEKRRPSEGYVVLSPSQLKASDIELATAGPAKIREILPLYGVISPNAERMRDVAARYPGLIRSITHKIGDAVRQGDTLATVESNESLQSYAVTAPLSGVITARNANVGEQTGEKPLFVVADLSTVWVDLSLFPRDAAKVHVGQRARVKSPDAGAPAEGKVTYVAPFGSSANQTLTARVQLDNSHRQWAPGLYVTADLTTNENDAALSVRNTAIQTLNEAPVVFVQTPKGFAARPVRLGRSDGEITSVLQGIEVGATYAATNSYVLKAEALKAEAAED